MPGPLTRDPAYEKELTRDSAYEERLMRDPAREIPIARDPAYGKPAGPLTPDPACEERSHHTCAGDAAAASLSSTK